MSTIAARTPSRHDILLTSDRPWLGLASFARVHRHYFFGRKNDVQDLFDRILHRRLTILFGKSGLGKTSLIQAGLMPQLDASNFEPIYIRLAFDSDSPSPEQQVVEKILEALAYGMPEEDLDCVGLWDLLNDPIYGLANRDAKRSVKLVLIFDQFEELHTLGEPKQNDEANSFLDVLSAIVEDRPTKAVLERMEVDDEFCDRVGGSTSNCKILMSLREDYLHWLERWRTRMPSVMDNRFELYPLCGHEALQAVLGPAEKRSKRDASLQPILDPETAESIVRFVAGNSDLTIPLEELDNIPPLLNLVCERLNERRLKQGEDTIQLLDVKGSASRVLSNYYESCFKGMPDTVRQFVEERLVSASGFRQPTNHDTALAELTELAVENPGEVLDTLIDRRLISIEERGGVPRLELTHDILTPIVAESRNKRKEDAEFAKKKSAALAKYQRRIRVMLAALLASVAVAAIAFSLIVYLKASEANAKTSEANAKASEARAKASEVRAKASEARAKASETDAKATSERLRTTNETLKENQAELERQRLEAIRREEETKSLSDEINLQNKALEREKGANQKLVALSSEASFVFGQQLLNEDQLGNSVSLIAGKEKFQEVIAHWVRALELDATNTNAARAIYLSLRDRSRNELRLPSTENWEIPANVEKTEISPSGMYVYWREGNTIHVRGKEIKRKFKVSNSLKRIQFDNTGELLLAFDDKSIFIFDISTGTTKDKSFDGKRPVAFCVAGKQQVGVVSLKTGKTPTNETSECEIYIFDIATVNLNYSIITNKIVEGDALFDGGYVMTPDLLNGDGTKTWHMAFTPFESESQKPTGRQLQEISTLIDMERSYNEIQDATVKLANDHSKIVVFKSKTEFRFYDVENASEIYKIPNSFSPDVRFKLSPNGKYLVAFGGTPGCGTTQNLFVYDIRQRFMLPINFRHLAGVNVPTENVPVFSEDDQVLTALTSEGKLLAIDLRNRQVLVDFMPTVPCKGFGFDANKNNIVALGIDNRLQIISIKQNESNAKVVTRSLEFVNTRPSQAPRSGGGGDELSISFDAGQSEFRVDSPHTSYFLDSNLSVKQEEPITASEAESVADSSLRKRAVLEAKGSLRYDLVVREMKKEVSRIPIELEDVEKARLLDISSSKELVALLINNRIYVWDYVKREKVGTPWLVDANQKVTRGRFHPESDQFLVEQYYQTACSRVTGAVVYEVGEDQPISFISSRNGIQSCRFINQRDAILVLSNGGILKVVDSRSGLPISNSVNVPKGCIDVTFGNGHAVLLSPTKLHKIPLSLFVDENFAFKGEVPKNVLTWCSQLAGLRSRSDGGFSIIPEYRRQSFFARKQDLPAPWDALHVKIFAD